MGEVGLQKNGYVRKEMKGRHRMTNIPKDRVFVGLVTCNHDGANVIHPKNLHSTLTNVLSKCEGRTVRVTIHCIEDDIKGKEI